MTNRDPRRSIWEFLVDSERDDSYINIAILDLHRRLDSRDRPFATELIFGSMRMRLFLDHVIDRLSNRDVDRESRSVLRLGIYEALEMDTADHAVVNEYVELSKAVIGRGRSSFINAILRRVVSERDHWNERADLDLTIRTSHPRWIVDAYEAILEPAMLVEELLSHNQPATVHAVSFEGLPAELATPSPLTPYGYRLKVPPGELEAVRGGKSFIQDEGSQLLCEVALHTDPHREYRWLDLCAGPGGKFSYLAHFLSPEQLIGNELHPHRAELVRKRNPRHQILSGDGRTLSVAGAGFDRVLIDAPCTGIGALRRHPDARWRRNESDLKDLVRLQRDLMVAGAKFLNPGGLLLYATCSPHLLETKAQVFDFLSRQKDFVIEPIQRDHLPDRAEKLSHDVIDPTGFLQLLTSRDGTDAMFMVLLRKTR